ncbi:MAG: radical SAM family heme chaperone HemW [Ilumatobacteraceae bacterium]|jgi:putative oxygen-independent coproporphyrinogen III oxidase
MTAPSDFGVYIHVPFCAHRCGYCAFATWTDRGHLEARYLRAVRSEIEQVAARGMPPATSIFVGGGTPSLVDPSDLAATIAAVPVLPGAEVTVECNPDDVDLALLETLAGAGVNRISLGVQSMSSHVLSVLDRRHDPANVVRAVTAISESGIPTFNIDLIYGAAGETASDWERTVRSVLELEPPHVSAYGLTVEPGTPLAESPELHPDDDVLADRYEVVDELLSGAGRQNYEVSNWAIPGHECRHNLVYWHQGDYRGFGCAAHSHRSGRRWWNVRTPDRYTALVEAGDSAEAAGEDLDDATREFERLELALRLRTGVPIETLDGDSLAGLVERVGDAWVLTRRGRLMANEVSTRLRVGR